MALKTSTDKIGSDERKTESKSNKEEINETKENNAPEYTKKSKVNKKRNYKKHTASSKANTTFIFTPSGISNSVFYERYPTFITMPILPTPYPVFTCDPQYLGAPFAYNWSLANTCVSNTVCSFSGHPLSIVPPNLLSTQVCPYICPVTSPILSEPMLPFVAPDFVSPLVGDFCSANVLEHTLSSSANMYSEGYMESLIGEPLYLTKDMRTKFNQQEKDPLDYYLTLPKDLFPTARMIAVDPNPLIDEICRQVDIYKHTSWILDLEFGVPRAPVSRSIAIYDVQFNSIHCKNNPGAVHPGFASCSQDFKNAFLFYYDCVISAWYGGYMMVTGDESVANFQYWLHVPMQLLGMCWP